MKTPRFLLCAANSGSGKTTIACGLMQAFVDRGMKTAAFKCGPDYIDPMFHAEVIGAQSRNLDAFFTQTDTLRALLARVAKDAEISVIEGVMGYYDGIANTDIASSYAVAKQTQTPVVLIVNAQGMSLSSAAIVKGFVGFRQDSGIQGVILNRVSAMLYPELKAKIEEECGITVYGYLPKAEDLMIESRHLGLVRPEEVVHLREKLHALAAQLEKTIDIDGLLALAQTAPEIDEQIPARVQCGAGVRLGVAKDAAFCFYYEDNLELFREFGMEIVPFSPLFDEKLPQVDGIYLGGGYPELHAAQLASNTTMLDSIRDAAQKGLPIYAECGGFLYLHRSLEDMDGRKHALCGLVQADAYRTKKLGRFGYIELTAQQTTVFGDKDTRLRGHEFHYFDTTDAGDAFEAVKPVRGTTWSCGHVADNLLCGFPHFYLYSNPDCAQYFVEQCARFGAKECAICK